MHRLSYARKASTQYSIPRTRSVLHSRKHTPGTLAPMNLISGFACHPCLPNKMTRLLLVLAVAIALAGLPATAQRETRPRNLKDTVDIPSPGRSARSQPISTGGVFPGAAPGVGSGYPGGIPARSSRAVPAPGPPTRTAPGTNAPGSTTAIPSRESRTSPGLPGPPPPGVGGQPAPGVGFQPLPGAGGQRRTRPHPSRSGRSGLPTRPGRHSRPLV